ncbi:MAG: 2OG-Fe(II) oxygenase [Hyphomonadaceae bacterium]|nr:2OG-Fe(II) oxygenase [Hyphomonadaceae bacterium]
MTTGGDFPAPPSIGAPVPWFAAPTDVNRRFHLHTAAGRWIMLAFIGSLRAPQVAPFLEKFAEKRHLFDDRAASFFGVGVDPSEEADLATALPGVRYFRDYDRSVSRLFGAAREADASYRPFVLILDRTLRVTDAASITQADHIFDRLEARMGPEGDPPITEHPPVLIAPRIFDADLCARLVAYFHAAAPTPSGFMREVDGRTVPILDHSFKSRKDATITDEALRIETQARVRERLIPMVERAFGWRATRMERYIVARYGADEEGHFNPHRDNTTRGTAHRKFAVTINLNAEDYEGGDLRFPEFGQRTYRAPTGGAVVFGCGLLHEATRVTRGDRFAFLPFLYDEAGAKLRESNAAFVDNSASEYRA